MARPERAIIIDAPEAMQSVFDAVIMRAGYLFPHLVIEKRGGALVVSGAAEAEHKIVAKEIRYLLYREHIKAEFAPYRRKALDRVYGGSR